MSKISKISQLFQLFVNLLISVNWFCCLYIWCCNDVWYLWCVCVFLGRGVIVYLYFCCDDVWYLWCVFLGRGRLCSKRWLDCPSWPSANVINDKLILYYHVSGGWYIFSVSNIVDYISGRNMCCSLVNLGGWD